MTERAVDLLRDAEGRLLVSELELVELSLFFRHSGAAAERLASALRRRIERSATPSGGDVVAVQ